MLTQPEFVKIWEYLRRNTVAREQLERNELKCMTDYFTALQSFSDELLMIAAQRHILIGNQWFPTIGELRRAGLAWLELGLGGKSSGEAELALMNGNAGGRSKVADE